MTSPCDPRCGSYDHAGPDSYLAWHEWAEQKSRRYEQQQCPGCGKWTIWVGKSRSRTPSVSDAP